MNETTQMTESKEFLDKQPKLYPAHEHHDRKLNARDKIALFINEKIGSFWFFVFCVLLVVVWTVWNVMSPPSFRFDDAQFNIWQYVSSAFQIIMMPLIMVVQQIQLQHAEARSEFSYLASKRSMGENALMISYLEALLKDAEKNEEMRKKIDDFIAQHDDRTVVLPEWMVAWRGKQNGNKD